METLGKYISIDPSIHAGMPCIAGTRVTVAEILAALDAGYTPETVRSLYPGVGPQAVLACLATRTAAPAPGTAACFLVESEAVAQ